MKINKMTATLFLVTAVLSGCHAFKRENRVCYKQKCYAIELAIADEERMKGLQRRPYLNKNKGMLFVLDGQSPHRFWMKNTLIPLDILWLDYDGKIIYIEHDAPSCEKDPCPLYGTEGPATYVLEINAGEAARLDMQVGERLDIYIPHNSRGHFKRP